MASTTADRSAVPRPRPVVTDDNAVFWEAAADGRLVAQQCSECGRLRHPPRPMCPRCRSLSIDVVELSGRGALYSYAILHHPKHPAFDYPLLVALVELEEGIRMVSNVVDIDPADVRIGMALEVGFEPRGADAAVPVFHPASESPGAV